jgi:glutamyl endopeptidase
MEGGHPLAGDVLGWGPRWRRVSADEARQYPLSAVASLRLHVLAPSGDHPYFLGTGWFTAPRALVTAAHVLDVEKAWREVSGARSWHLEIVPGMVSGSGPFEASWASALTRHPFWDGRPASDADIAVLHTASDGLAADQCLPLAGPLQPSPAPAPVRVVGYPYVVDSGDSLVEGTGEIKALERSQLFYDIDTEGGQSGGPILSQSGPTTTAEVIGIHCAGRGHGRGPLANSLNVGLHLRPDLIQWVVEVCGNAPNPGG